MAVIPNYRTFTHTTLHIDTTQSGYVEGVEAGKEEGLKEGFSSGFSSGVSISTPWAILKGEIKYTVIE